MLNEPARGRLFIMSAPSGAGKTSLVKALNERYPGVVFSVSYTTRPPRQNETDGDDYFFVDRDQFEELIEDGEFLEHAEVFGHLYGTSRSHVDGLLEAGKQVILEIDWQGARQVRAVMPEAINVFILPPSVEELERRLRGRGTDPEEVVQRRLDESRDDIRHYDEFDHVVVNDDFNSALAQLEALAHNPEQHTNRPDLRSFVADLLV